MGMEATKALTEEKSKEHVVSARVKALCEAAKIGYLPEMRKLIERGVDVSAYDEGGVHALWHAASEGHVSAIDLLVQNGAQVNQQTDWYDHKDNAIGLTAADTAVYFGKVEALRRLIQVHKADVGVTNFKRRTLLHYACMSRQPEMVQILLDEFGLNPNATQIAQQTPLMYACCVAIETNNEHCAEIIDLLMERRADINKKDTYGFTALHWAAHDDNVIALLAILKYEPPMSAINNDGETPLMVAERRGNDGAVWILQHAQKDQESQVVDRSKSMELNDAEKMIGFVQALRASKKNQAVSKKLVEDDDSEAQSEERSRKYEDSASGSQHSRASKN